MTLVKKLVAGAALASGLAMAATAPASAGVSVGIGIGVPGPGPYPYHDWCYHHPYRCGHYGGYYGPPPAEGVWVNGFGFWWGGRWWGHRGWNHGHWHYW